jgi:SPP1 gp7 family putative phage head morphogenesis protein
VGAITTPEDRGPVARELRAVAALHRLDRATEIEERAWEKAVRRLFVRQQEATLARLNGKRGNRVAKALETRQEPSPGDLFDRTFWQRETEAVVADLIERTLALGADALELAFDLSAQGIPELIEARAHDLAGLVTDTTYQAIRQAMIDGVAAGEGIPDLAARIEHVFDVATSSRATTIARTEVVSAYNAGKAAAIAQAPADVVAGQEWVATRDGRTRDTHVTVNGQVRAVGQPFSVGSSMMLYPGDPAGPAKETVNCRCTLIALTPEQFAEATAGRAVSVDHARVALALVGATFDEHEFRTALLEVA